MDVATGGHGELRPPAHPPTAFVEEENEEAEEEGEGDIDEARRDGAVARGVRRGKKGRTRDNAWTVLVAATLVQACGGLAYSFVVYSRQLRTIYPKQSDVDLLGTMKDVGAYFGVVGGALYDYAGPQATLLVGALMHVGGYLGVWAVLTRRAGFVDLPLWKTSAIIAVAANGNSFFDTAALLSSMHNFPMETGTVAGLLKSYLGLSSALFAQLYAVLVPAQAENRAAGFVMLCAVGGGAVAVSMTPFIVKVGNNGGGDEHDDASSGTGDATFRAAQFRRLTGAVAALVAWVVLAATLNDPAVVGLELPRWANWILTAGMLAVLLSPWGLLAASGALRGKYRSATKRQRSMWRGRGARHEDVERNSLFGALLGSENHDHGDAESDIGISAVFLHAVDLHVRDDDNGVETEGNDASPGCGLHAPSLPSLSFSSTSGSLPVVHSRVHLPAISSQRGPPPLKGQTVASLTLLASLRSVEFWLLFASISVSSGAAMTLVNNMDAVATAAGAPPSTASALVSLFSVCNCLGRLGGGAASERGVYLGLPRPAFLAVAQLTVAAGMGILAAFPNPEGVFASVALVGLALGAHWAFLPSACSEIFGPDHIGAVYGGLSLSPMLGSYVLSTRVFGSLYDAAYVAATTAAAASTHRAGGVVVVSGSKTAAGVYMRGYATGNQSDAAAAGGAAAAAAAAAKGNCFGATCFRKASVVCAASSLASLGLTLVLCLRTAHVYAYHRRRLVGASSASRSSSSFFRVVGLAS